jgi:hypothetical protein
MDDFGQRVVLSRNLYGKALLIFGGSLNLQSLKVSSMPC